MAGLDTYRARRDFAATPEPDGRAARRPRGARATGTRTGAYVIQKHAARRLHYDLRLEMDGVLKSWAVTRGPSLVAGEKRLAVHVEDHPLAYGGFEGTIPPGQYGAGNVIVWDRGTWAAVGDAAAGYAKGHLEFELHGEKLSGRWHLVRMAPRAGEKKDNWLLIKADDTAARPEGAPEITQEAPLSVLSGRDVADVGGPGAAVWNSTGGTGPAGGPSPAARPSGATSPAPPSSDGAPAAQRAAAKRGAAERGAAKTSPAKTPATKTPATKTASAKTSSTKTSPAKTSSAKTSSAEIPATGTPAGKPASARASGASSASAPAGKASPALRAGADAPVPLALDLPKGARRAALPAFVPPALATLAPRAPAGRRHVHEIKFDGYRLQVRLEGGRARLITRTGLDWTERFGRRITAALAALPVTDALIDGEVVVEGGNGASDFSALQADLSAGRDDRFVYYAFDLLHLDGHDLTRVPLLARKALLERLLAGQEAGGAVRYSAHFEDDGALVLQHACRLSLEGVVSKLKDAPYHSGRSRDWIKSKCVERQEFVVGGFVPSTTTRGAVGSLVLGVYEGGRLMPVGRVGTGFTNQMAAQVHALLAPDMTQESPFARKLSAEEARGVVFVAPKHVVEVEFRAWTGDGHLRHASYRGLRDDKPATEVVREAAPAAAAADDPPPQRRVRLTHPDRIYWPDAGVTKEGLADYYTDVWRFMAPFVTGRPLALVRCPDGIAGPHFFQKHPWKGADKAIRPVLDPRAPGDPPYLAIDTLDGLLALVQGAALEIHPFGATLADWERPDMLVMDLDPGDNVPWDAVIAAAREVKARLEAEGLAAFVKTSGGKGLHVCAPLVPKADWTAVKAFTKAMAEAMAADAPEHFVATIAKAKRTGRILVDYLRNQRGATAVAAYSARARAGAPVSMPVGWEELGAQMGPQHFTVLNAPARLARLGADPWGEFRAAAVPLPGAARAGRRR